MSSFFLLTKRAASAELGDPPLVQEWLPEGFGPKQSLAILRWAPDRAVGSRGKSPKPHLELSDPPLVQEGSPPSSPSQILVVGVLVILRWNKREVSTKACRPSQILSVLAILLAAQARYSLSVSW
nr:hypothetical protein Iba_chr09fCG10800 [Ipomoea batatas]